MFQAFTASSIWSCPSLIPNPHGKPGNETDRVQYANKEVKSLRDLVMCGEKETHRRLCPMKNCEAEDWRLKC